MMTQEIKDALSVFEPIVFDEKEHSYHINGKRCVSVTELIGKYKKPFQAEYWASIKGAQENVSAQDMIRRWDRKRDVADAKGKVVHSYIESLITGTGFEYPETGIRAAFMGEDPVLENFKKISKQVDKFMLDIRGKMMPIASELVVGDEELLLCGTIDQLFHNHTHDELQIWDWKTNAKIDEDSKYPLLPPIDSLTDCHLNIYSLQTNLYKLIWERKTRLKMGRSNIVWFNENNDTYRVFKCRDLMTEARLIVVHRA